MDFHRPSSSSTARGARHVLVLVDYATRIFSQRLLAGLMSSSSMRYLHGSAAGGSQKFLEASIPSSVGGSGEAGRRLRPRPGSPAGTQGEPLGCSAACSGSPGLCRRGPGG
uniref:Uncharacterized protein n=1 Tax=Sphaerodactylus townsendi TaxID=933632 RepID=A0ACB8F477_9SAUR